MEDEFLEEIENSIKSCKEMIEYFEQKIGRRFIEKNRLEKLLETVKDKPESEKYLNLQLRLYEGSLHAETRWVEVYKSKLIVYKKILEEFE